MTFKATVLRAVEVFEEEDVVEKPTMDDRNKTFRTRFILFWLFANAVLGQSLRRQRRPRARALTHVVHTALLITRMSTNTQSLYFSIILWVTFGLSCVRLCGLLYYLFGEYLFRLARLCSRGRK